MRNVCANAYKYRKQCTMHCRGRFMQLLLTGYESRTGIAQPTQKMGGDGRRQVMSLQSLRCICAALRWREKELSNVTYHARPSVEFI